MTGERGFTLLEMLAALAVMGLILAGLAGGLRFGEWAAAVQAGMVARHADMGAADRLLRRLVADMDPGDGGDRPALDGSSAAVAFTTVLPDAAEGEPREAEVAIQVDPAHRLQLRWKPVLHAAPVGPAPVPREAVLLDGVERVEFAYWGHDADGTGVWLAGWTERDIPPLLRIRLVFPAAARRSWPDMVIATQRRRPG